MARTIRRVLPCLFLLVAAVLNAQSSSQPADVEIILGQSAVPLYGPWKFQVGDSPTDPATQERLWAETGFDDSHWETADLTPVAGLSDSLTGDAHQAKSGMAKGHVGYAGWAWYRLRLRVVAGPGALMAIDGPVAAGAWQLYSGGKLLGSFGKFDNRGSVRRIYGYRPLMFLLPPVKGTESGVVTETLAFRVWMNSRSLIDANVGGLRSAPLLVAGEAMRAQSRLDWQDVLLGKLNEAAYIAMFLLFAVLASSLVLFDRSDRVYWWVAATMLVAPIGYILMNLCATTTWLDARVADILVATNDALWAAGWVMVWWVWFHLRRPAWGPKAVAVLMVPFAAADALKAGLTDYGFALPHGRNSALLDALGATSLAFRLVFVVTIAVVVAIGIRKEGKEGWFALPAVAALAVEMIGEAFGMDVVGRFHGIDVQIWDLTDPFLVAVLAFLMLRRLLHSLERQRRMSLDVKQAQEVQQVILPDTRTTLPGLLIESEYRPAREVGGDFFQIIPNKSDGSLLIVAGDVTGKGLKAGMLVALLVGAIRMAEEVNTDPLFLLQALNRRLLGRGDAQATCVALRIAEDGKTTLANAGHIAPYLNGEPLAMEGSLPLGIIEAAEFSMMYFQLRDGDKLVLMSDGIVEATDANGKLFGFERVNEMLRTARSAAQIAGAAQAFGQEDDISVISVTRVPVAEPALA